MQAIETTTTKPDALPLIDGLGQAMHQLRGVTQIMRHLAACPDVFEPDCMLVLAHAMDRALASHDAILAFVERAHAADQREAAQ
jgi:hypothetical protein